MNALELIKDGGIRAEMAGTVHRFVDVLNRLGIEAKGFSPKGLEHLAHASDAELALKIRSARSALSDLEFVAGGIERPEPVTELSRRTLETALGRLGWRISESFLTSIEKDEVVELYSADMVQVFRSLNFFKYTTYSILDLSLHEWFVLYERPRSVLSLMHEHVGQVVMGGLDLMPCRVPDHIMRENFDDGLSEPFEPRCLKVSFKNIGAAFDVNTGAVAGLAVSCETSLVSRGADAMVMGFV